jgi:hypothetical protein
LTAEIGVAVFLVLPGPTRSDGVESFLEMVAKLSGKSVDEMAANFAAVRPIEEVVSGV